MANSSKPRTLQTPFARALGTEVEQTRPAGEWRRIARELRSDWSNNRAGNVAGTIETAVQRRAADAPVTIGMRADEAEAAGLTGSEAIAA